MTRLCILFYFLSAFGLAQTNFYEEGIIQKIELYFLSDNWDYQLDTAKLGKDGYVRAQGVKINNHYFENVGVKYKGNSSYDSSSLKNPIHIELDAFKEQNYQGVKDIKLSNAYADPSMVREVLAYHIARNYVPAPQANFAQVYINQTYWGLYTNTESINKAFCNNHFFSNTGVFIKCNPNLTPSPSVKSNLKYLQGDSTAYYNYYEMKSEYGWKHLQALCDTVSNYPTKTQQILNMDRLIWMLAFNALLVNLDSYTGAFSQNYYLYKDPTGKFNPLLWDLNMSFGGFPFLGSSNTSLANLSISNMQTLPITIHNNDAYWPLITTVLSNNSYKKKYVAHLRTIVSDFFSSGKYVDLFNFYQNLIDEAVQTDARKTYNYTQFKNSLTSNVSVGSYSVPGIQTLMSARINYLNTTNEFTANPPVILKPGYSSAQLLTAVTITANVTNANSVYLAYRHNKRTNFEQITMFDDGLHNDGAASDQVFGASFTLTSNQTQYYLYAENDNAAIFSPEQSEHVFHEINLHSLPQPGSVVINEFLAENKSDVRNEYHIHQDWIELYNTTSSVISLANYFISDDLDNKPKYLFPSTATIAPKGFLTLWADEFLTNSGPIHTNFKLNGDAGSIVLSNGGYSTLDVVTYTEQEPDISMARCPDGYGGFELLRLPTFGLNNCVVGLNDDMEINANLLVYPNPANQTVHIAYKGYEAATIQIIDTMGHLIYKNRVVAEVSLDTTNLPNGIYIVIVGNASQKLIVSH